MNCLHTHLPVTTAECAGIICNAKESAMLVLCRGCVYGQQLMRTVALPKEETEPEAPAPEVNIEPQRKDETMETITAKELFEIARVPQGSQSLLLTKLRAGEMPGGPHGKRIAEELDARGLTVAQVVVPPRRAYKWRDEEPAKQDITESAAIARELDTSELTEELEKRVAGQKPVPGTIGSHMRFEDILRELAARMPEATITVTMTCAER